MFKKYRFLKAIVTVFVIAQVVIVLVKPQMHPLECHISDVRVDNRIIGFADNNKVDVGFITSVPVVASLVIRDQNLKEVFRVTGERYSKDHTFSWNGCAGDGKSASGLFFYSIEVFRNGTLIAGYDPTSENTALDTVSFWPRLDPVKRRIKLKLTVDALVKITGTLNGEQVTLVDWLPGRKGYSIFDIPKNIDSTRLSEITKLKSYAISLPGNYIQVRNGKMVSSSFASGKWIWESYERHHKTCADVMTNTALIIKGQL